MLCAVIIGVESAGGARDHTGIRGRDLMGGFVEAVLSFPTVIFTPLLVVVIGYWIVVVAGGGLLVQLPEPMSSLNRTPDDRKPAAFATAVDGDSTWSLA